MALDFPNSPTTGTTYSAAGVVWKWDGAKWVPNPSAAGAIAIGSTTITGGVSGRILYDNAGVFGEYDAPGATAYLNVFTTTLKGLAPSSGGGTTNFLRADGTWAVPPGGGITPAALTKTDDTNVTLTLGGTPATALLQATSITVGWAGTLAAARLNANVVQAITNDTNVTGTISAQTLTLGWTGTLANARLATMAAHTYKGNNTGATATPIDVTNTQLTADLNVFTSALKGLAPLSGGGTTNFLRADGTWAAPPGGGGGGGLIGFQVFTSSGTYTPTSGMVSCLIECVGGGGAGGGCIANSTNSVSGAGGGSGGYSKSRKLAAAVGASQTVTIGAAGTGGGGAGGNGGDTSVGTLVIAKGGTGGGQGNVAVPWPAGGPGGVAGTGDIAAAGNPGGGGWWSNQTSDPVNGAGSALGGGAPGPTPVGGSAATGNNASNYGAGGSPGLTQGGSTNASGSNGSAGIVIITEFG